MSNDPSTPNALSNQSTTAITTTMFMMDFILLSIGMYVLAAQSSTPTTINTMTRLTKDIYFPYSNNDLLAISLLTNVKIIARSVHLPGLLHSKTFGDIVAHLAQLSE
ncbi:hypothetical protein HQ394_07225 [Defluviicoccus vanus]|uniref:Uncharacterized protein n=1 Tax=Defluviicoccus vanus TaxID=111831 RepID=A0A7H1N0C7_9PROT|nr:hypothetical protein HQ394_07225 [Defluviicoccus vanus]